MGKRRLTTLKFEEFEKFDIEKQAEIIERETRKLLKKLPKIRKNLSAYDDTSDELYNLEQEQLELYGKTYASALRGGELTTPSSIEGYQRFVKQLLKYNSKSIKELAIDTANNRMESFMKNIRENGSLAEIQYAEQLFSQMNDYDKIAFTRSKYFLDTDNWGSEQFSKFTEDYTGEYSIMTMKLELFMISKDKNTRNIYNKTYHNTDEVVSRKSSTKGQKRKKA